MSSVKWRETLSASVPLAVLGTLICCALPIALVSLGAGAAVASLVSSFPGLVVLSRNKAWVFVLAAVLLATDHWILYRSRASTCQVGGMCHSSHPFGRWMRRAFWASLAAYVVGIAAAYLALPIAQFLH